MGPAEEQSAKALMAEEPFGNDGFESIPLPDGEPPPPYQPQQPQQSILSLKVGSFSTPARNFQNNQQQNRNHQWDHPRPPPSPQSSEQNFRHSRFSNGGPGTPSNQAGSNQNGPSTPKQNFRFSNGGPTSGPANQHHDVPTPPEQNFHRSHFSSRSSDQAGLHQNGPSPPEHNFRNPHFLNGRPSLDLQVGDNRQDGSSAASTTEDFRRPHPRFSNDGPSSYQAGDNRHGSSLASTKEDFRLPHPRLSNDGPSSGHRQDGSSSASTTEDFRRPHPRLSNDGPSSGHRQDGSSSASITEDFRRPRFPVNATPNKFASNSPHQYRRSYNNSGSSNGGQFQRRSWPNRNTPVTPKFDPDRYKHGWLFLDEANYEKEYLQKMEESGSEGKAEEEDRPRFRTAPVIFMFDLTPMVPFFTNKFCFSNHFMCERLKIDDVLFRCTEQYYMFYKARVFDDKQAMREIMDTADARQMKRIGARVVGFEQAKWYRVAIQVMVIASMKKYEQNPTLRRQLFETCGTQLVETNPTDERWGVGLSLDDWRIRDKEMWRGQNVLGRVLMGVREALLERPEFAAEREEMLREIGATLESARAVGCFASRFEEATTGKSEAFGKQPEQQKQGLIIDWPGQCC